MRLLSERAFTFERGEKNAPPETRQRVFGSKPIIGTLKLKGTASLGTTFTELAEEAVEFGENVDVSDGVTETTVTVDTEETEAKFYQAVIE